MRDIKKVNFLGWILVAAMSMVMGFVFAFPSSVMAEGGKNRFGDELITEGFQIGCLDQLGEVIEATVTITTCEEDDPGSCVMVVVDCSKFND